jgi:3-oxoacid CoA-transferase
MYLKGEVSLELVPQGTLVERLRAHAAGIPSFFTPTGASTAVEFGSIPIRYNVGGFKNGILINGNKKESRVFNGRRCVLEPALKGDVAFIHAWKVDEVGNVVFRYGISTLARYLLIVPRYTAKNFSPTMAKNAALTIVEVRYVYLHFPRSPKPAHRPRKSYPAELLTRMRFTSLASTSTALSVPRHPSRSNLRP